MNARAFSFVPRSRVGFLASGALFAALAGLLPLGPGSVAIPQASAQLLPPTLCGWVRNSNSDVNYFARSGGGYVPRNASAASLGLAEDPQPVAGAVCIGAPGGACPPSVPSGTYSYCRVPVNPSPPPPSCLGNWLDITGAVRAPDGSSWHARCVPGDAAAIEVRHFASGLININTPSNNPTGLWPTAAGPVNQVVYDRLWDGPGARHVGFSGGQPMRVPYWTDTPWSAAWGHPLTTSAPSLACNASVWNSWTEQFECAQWQVNSYGGPPLNDSLFYAYRYDAATGIFTNSDRSTTYRLRFARNGCTLTVHPTSGDRRPGSETWWWLIDHGAMNVNIC